MQQHGEQPLKNFVNSTMAIAFTRLVMPVLLAVVGYLMVGAMTDLKDANAEVRKTLSKLTDTVHDQSRDLAVVKVQIDATTKSIDRLSNITDLIKKP